MKDSTISPWRAGAARLGRGILWVIFALVLLIPKVNRLRRRRILWNLVRVAVAFVGGVLLIFGAEGRHGAALLPIGVLLLLIAALLNSERPEVSVDARARELGALIAVDGGFYVGSPGKQQRARRARLFVGPDRLWVLDAALQVLVEIPLQQIRTICVAPAGSDWSLRVDWNEMTAEFLYKGSFAEHLACVADATVRSRLRRELPVLR